jgi:act minimal PKS acyl carrier protein
MTIAVQEICRILVSCAGAPEIEVTEAEFADTDLAALGYESLALMETAAVIERTLGVRVPDETLLAARTPRELAAAVQAQQAVPA